MNLEHLNVSTKSQMALRASQLYYVQDETMDRIARELRTSRSTVSRLLAHARETGLVEIRVRSPIERLTELENGIRTRFGVAALVVPVSSSTSDADRLDRVAIAAARLLTHRFDSNMSLGVAWGATIAAVGRHLHSSPTHNSKVVQLNGAGNTSSTGLLYAGEILQRFGDAFDATVEQFPVPAFFDDPATRAAMWRERSIKRMLSFQSQLDIALFSIGSPVAEVPSRLYMGEYLEGEDYRTLAEDEVAGDAATVFFRSDGSTAGIRLNERSSGPTFELLRRIPRRICVVAGTAKLTGLLGALAAKLPTDLIIDESAARAMLK